MTERDWSKPLDLQLLRFNDYPKDMLGGMADHAPQVELPLMHRHFGGVKTMDTHDRLNSLWYRVFNLMKDGQWRTLKQIQQECGGTEASCSARLRDCRKTGFGSHGVDKWEERPGLYLYRLNLNPQYSENQARRYFHAKHPKAPTP